MQCAMPGAGRAARVVIRRDHLQPGAAQGAALRVFTHNRVRHFIEEDSSLRVQKTLEHLAV